jgi:flagellin
MGLRINTNTQSIAAQRHLGINSMNAKGSLERLASGARITKAADDAAGLAISENMRANIRSIRQNVRNTSDGISMVQVAEGGLNEVGNILIRMRELSIQGASDTIGDQERGFIDREVQQLSAEVDRISATTEFNGMKLLDGNTPELEIQIGQKNDPVNDRFILNTGELKTDMATMGLSGISTATKEESQGNLDKVDQALSMLASNRSTLGAVQNRLQSTVNTLGIYDENLSAARSRIYDLDVASESSELTKNNILQQVGVSVLSQANSNAMLALKLIG